MKPHSDFEELLRLLKDRNADFMIVGGYAVAFYGYPRFTKDLDILYLNSPENTMHVQNALVEFGFQRSEIPLDALRKKGNVLTFGVEPLRVDLMNEVDGVSYQEAASESVQGQYGAIEVSFIGKNALIKNKKSTPRLRDKGDAEELEKLE
jgi:predicted nucleotidyltransferase